jgi:YegS/Rv2252/BmrU family lipid kinase
VQPAILIYNPRAGRWRNHRLIGRLVAELSIDGPVIEAYGTEGPGAATILAREAAAAGAPLVFVLGGDGTVREAAAGLLDTETALAVLPGGTTNVIAHALGLPVEPLAAARALKRLPVQDFDVGLCGEEVFLMQASLGLDALALSRVSPLAKRFLGRGAVALAGLGAWWQFDYPEFDLLIDGHTLSATFAAVCNMPFYGGPVRLIPDAEPTDGRLEILLFRGTGRGAALDFVRQLLRGTHLERDDVSILTTEEVVLTEPDLPLQLDGDAQSYRLGTEIRLAAARLRILAPSTIMGRR